MQKLFEIKPVKTEYYPQLKQLWNTCFDGEDQDALNNFFEKTATPESVLATFSGEKIVSAMFLLESEIVLKSKRYSAWYIYGVCTHPDFRGKGIMKNAFKQLDELAVSKNIQYLFLVPATEKLFEMYEKLGYQTGFTYENCTVDFYSIFQLEEWCEAEDLKKADTDIDDIFKGAKLRKQFSFEQYRKFKEVYCSDEYGYVLLKENAFNSFCLPVGPELRLACNGDGYCLYGVDDEKITVFERFCKEGCKLPFYCVVADDSLEYTVNFRKPYLNGDAIPFGMYKGFGNVPKLTNAFLGVPYGG